MLTIQRIIEIEVALEKFVDSCSAAELQAVILLANTKLGRQDTGAKNTEERTAILVPAQPTRKRAVKAGTKRKTAPRWTAEEDAQLRRLYPTTTAKVLADVLHRTERAITVRVSSLGFRKYKAKAEAKLLPEKTAPARKSTEKRRSESMQEEAGNRRERASAALNTAKQQEGAKAMRSLRVDARTTVLVPVGTNDAEYIANYKKKFC